ncbi:MAG: DUF2238 domain-containing protein [Acidobacteriota bacterium]|nr:DUF2238 domain-containing protein [Acidobacteriota bacterium]
MPTSQRYPWILAALFAAVWIALAIDPWYREDWALENVLVVVAVPVLVALYRRQRLSNLSYTLIFLFLCLHEIGAHHTYAEVPYDRWFETLTGSSFNQLVGWERNNFDRVIHFTFGLLLALPLRELTGPTLGGRKPWSWLVPLCLLIAASTLFELIEWAAAMIFGGDLGMAYLGTQGDIWDAHKDMALANAGAVLGLILTAGRIGRTTELPDEEERAG